MVLIKGIQKTTLIDYPGKIAAIIFLGGCNFRCPFCYNRGLVLNYKKLHTIREREALFFLKERKKYLEGVVVSGGEPCMQKGLPKFLGKIKKLGYLVKLDTNGSNPEMLKKILDGGLVDYVAIDIKSSPEKYDEAAGIHVDTKKIRESVEAVRKSGVEHELRTTAVPRLFDSEDAERIGRWLGRGENYFMQQFVPMEGCISKECKNKQPYSRAELEKFREIIKKYFGHCEIRGI